MPIKNTVPRASVGGVSEGAGAKAEGSNPFARTNSFACRGGGRHPGLLEGIALRGVMSERRSWSVRLRLVVSPTSRRRADDGGCPKGAEEGNVVGMRHKAYAPSPSTRDRERARRRVLHSVRRPVHVNPHYTPRRKPRWWGERESITVGQPWATRKNQHWGFHGRTQRGSPHATASSGRRRGVLKKRKEVEASVPARIKSSGLVARTSVVMLQKSVGEAWSRISSANALQKGRSRRVNGDLAGCEGQRVKPSARVSSEGESRVGLTARDGRGPAQGLGWRESAIQRFTHPRKVCVGRGTGTVTVTGS